MKYYSEKLNQTFDSEKECLKAEKTYEAEQAKAKALAEQKATDRKAAAEKVETARKAAVEANKVYREALNEFCNQYGTFHSSIAVNDIDDLFNWFFRF